MSRGDGAKDYRPAFPGTEASTLLELQYPSASRPEQFEAVDPTRRTRRLQSLSTIYTSPSRRSSSTTCPTTFLLSFPPTLRAPYACSSAPSNTKKSIEDFQAELTIFNKLIRDKLQDGTIPRIIDDMHAIPLSLVKRITAQSLQSHSLASRTPVTQSQRKRDDIWRAPHAVRA